MLLRDWTDPQKREDCLRRVVQNFEDELRREQLARENRFVPPADETDAQRLERIQQTGLIACSADLLAVVRANRGPLSEDEVSALLASVTDEQTAQS